MFHLVNKIHHMNHDIVRYYDLLTIELILYFYKGSFDECERLMDILVHFYPICHPKNQFLLFYLNNYLAIFKGIGEKLDFPSDILANGNESGLNHYMSGWTYMHKHNYSQALTKFYQAIKVYKKTNNKCRIILCETYINEILLMDKNYIDVALRSLDLIKEVEACSQVVFTIDKLYFHLSYSYFHLKEYYKAKKFIEKITNDDSFIAYLRLRIAEKTNDKLIDFKNLEDSKHNALSCLYFKYKKNKMIYIIK